MAVAIERQQYTLEEGVQAVVKRAMDGESVILAAGDIVDDLMSEALIECARVGLASKAHDALAASRGGIGADSRSESDSLFGIDAPRPLHPNRHYAKEYWLMALARNYEGADRTRRALFQFTVVDCEYLRGVAAGKVVGYSRLRDAMALAIGHLESSGAQQIAELPEAAQREIAEALS